MGSAKCLKNVEFLITIFPISKDLAVIWFPAIFTNWCKLAHKLWITFLFDQDTIHDPLHESQDGACSVFVEFCLSKV